MDKNKDIWALIVRYLDHNLSNEEEEKLEEWLDESSENRWALNIVSRIWKASEDKSQDAFLKELNLEEDWQRISEKMNPETGVEGGEKFAKYRRLRKRQKYFSNLLKVAAMILVIFTSVFLTLEYSDAKEEMTYEPVFKEITTSSAERARIQLGDGSHVILNSGSKLITPDTFKSNKRVVELQGQAFFEVQADIDRPFYVKNNDSEIQVLGTSFDVRSYSDDSDIRVAVKEGEVILRSSDDKSEEILLRPGELGYLDKVTKELNLAQVEDITPYLGWMEGRLYFQSTPVAEVLKHLERLFEVVFVVESESFVLTQKQFTADLKPRTIEDVMEVMAVSLNMDYKISDDTVTVK